MKKKLNQKEQDQRAFLLLEAIGDLPESQVEEALETPDPDKSPAAIYRYRRRPLWAASATAAILGIAILSGTVYLQIWEKIPSKTQQSDIEHSGSDNDMAVPPELPEAQNTDETPKTGTELIQPVQKPLPDGTIRLLSKTQNEKKKQKFEDMEDVNLNQGVQENGSKDSASQKDINDDLTLQPLTAGAIQPLSEIKETKKNLSISFTLQIGDEHDQALYQLACNNIIWHIQGKTDDKTSTVQCDGGSTLTATLRLPIKNSKIQADIDEVFLPDDINPDFSPIACITITSCPKNTDDTNENAINKGQLLIGAIQEDYYILYYS